MVAVAIGRTVHHYNRLWLQVVCFVLATTYHNVDKEEKVQYKRGIIKDEHHGGARMVST